MPTVTEAAPRHHTTTYALSNPVEQIADKPRADFTRDDLLRVIEEKQIERITFHYTGLDGKYKELKLPVSDARRAERVLAEGERVDGSSLFRGVVDVSCSDLYVVPVYASAFLNPFDERSLDFTCRFLNREGELAEFAPDSVLHKAARLLTDSTGLELNALGELEFFVLRDCPTPLYSAPRQRGYHEASPYVKSGAMLDEIVHHLSQITGAVKYAHSETGTLGRIESESPEIHGKTAEQWEVEFLPRPVEECADALVLARWVIRNVAYRHNCVATFAPKIEEGVAGNGMHVHVEVAKGGHNVMRSTAPERAKAARSGDPGSGDLSETAKRVIGGLCTHADSLTAFGNTVSAAYLRLVPNQEAPTSVCWSDSNRSAMIRVPLGWAGLENLAASVNAGECGSAVPREGVQTVELRTPDGSAMTHLLLAGITMAVEWGLSFDTSLEVAAKAYVPAGTVEPKKGLMALPRSCVESARTLKKKREMYERQGVFAPALTDYVCRLLEEENDDGMNARLAALPADDRLRETRKIMHKDLHRH
jgi:glutamine synthetase